MSKNFRRAFESLLLAWLIGWQGLATADDPTPVTPTVSGKVKRVVLYRGQALVTRQIQFEGPPGSQELVITDLPETIIEGSLFAESSPAMEVRAVRLRQRAVGVEPREEVRELDVQLEASQAALAAQQQNTDLVNQKIAYLDQLQTFVAPTAQVELTRGVLNAETLKELTQFAFEQRSRLATEQLALAKEHQELTRKIELLQRQKSEISNGSQHTIREAVLFIEKTQPGSQLLELNYRVSGCGWAPSYTVRAADDRKTVQIGYHALIEQISGENWDNIELTLSTASPTLSASGPSLAPFEVALVNLEHDESDTSLGIAKASDSWAQNRAQQAEANQRLGSLVDFQAKTSGNWFLNRLACSGQQMELANSIDSLQAMDFSNEALDAPSLSYLLPKLVSISSRSDQQVVRIFQGELASNFYHVATPLLSSYVYREAEIANKSNHDLLAGPVSVYIDNRFVGKADLPTVAQGETFVLGFGSDAQLRTRRELAKKSDALRGGNKELHLSYRLIIENYKSQEVPVRVFDRLPHSQRSDDVRIAVSHVSNPLSSDPIYLQRERERNILRWDCVVSGGATGEKAHVINYDFTLDYDRNFSVTDLSSNEASAAEFQKLEMLRRKR